MKLSDYLKMTGVINGLYRLIEQDETEDAMTTLQTLLSTLTCRLSEEDLDAVETEVLEAIKDVENVIEEEK